MTAICASGAFATSSCPKAPDYQVFSAGSINYNSAEFSGRIAAIEQINLETFKLTGVKKTLPAIVSAGTVDMQNSTISAGGVECDGPVRLTKSTVEGTVADHHPSARTRALTAAQRWMEDVSDELSKVSGIAPESGGKNVLVFNESDGKAAVFNISADQLTQAKSLEFHGTPGSLFILNVDGAAVAMRDIQFNLRGVNAGQIVLNFFDAKSLQITDSGSSDLGLPATILAPRTAVHLWSGKISGSVLVGNLMGNVEIDQAAPDWEKLCSIL